MGNTQASNPVEIHEPSETNCSMHEELEINAVNQLADEIIQAQEASEYSALESETNVTASEHFEPCPSMNQLNRSVYSAPKSETNVTMNEEFENCKDLANVVYSTYTAPPSETPVTLNSWVGDFSNYETPLSETNVTMAEKFRPCEALKDLESIEWGSEYTAQDMTNNHEAQWEYVEHLQRVLGIPDTKVVGIKGSDGTVTKVIDSSECLQHLEDFEPIPVHFDI